MSFVAGGAALLSACAGAPAPAPATPSQSPASAGGMNGMSGMDHGAMMGPATAAPSTVELPFLTTGRAPSDSFTPDLDLSLIAGPADAQLMAGAPTKVWTYMSGIVRGDASHVQTLPNTYLGPAIRVNRGEKVRLRFNNKLPDHNAQSVIHWHGLLVPEDMDGHPAYAIAPGQTYTYEFEVNNRAGTYWFHPHPHGQTAPQVYQGLAGLFIVSDAEEQALGLPSGEYDVPLILQDRNFDKNNQLLYFGQGMMSGMMEQMMGFVGDTPVVNGRPDYALDVSTRAYRLRLLNGSNARIFKLAWQDGQPLTIIGTDGGLLAQPVQRPYLMLSPGERAEVFVDFAGRKVGDAIKLVSLPFEGAEGVNVPASMMSQMNGVTPMDMTEGTLPLGAPFTVMTFTVARAEDTPYALPTKLARVDRLELSTAVNANAPREFAIDHDNMIWRFNGKQFEMAAADANEQVKLGATEAWTFVNKLNLGQMMDPMGMAHPIHLHGVQFQIVKRDLYVPELQPGYDTVRDGFVDEGWKDTFLLMPGEKVTVVMRFTKPGKFVYHCHNLEHEDQGLMRNFEVVG